jgi:cbb3-type cytochrome oxidase maturation protein
MAVIYVILPIALVLAAAAVAAFIWAVRHAQMDDLETPAMRMLHDDEPSGESAPRTSAAHRDASARETKRGERDDRSE